MDFDQRLRIDPILMTVRCDFPSRYLNDESMSVVKVFTVVVAATFVLLLT